MTKIDWLSGLRSFLGPLFIIVLFSAASLIPYAGLFFLVTLPAVLYIFCFLADFSKTLTSFLGTVCVILLLLIFFQNIWPIFALITVGLAGLLIAWTAGKDYPVEAVILVPALFILGVIGGYFVYSSHQLSIPVWDVIQKQVTEAIDLNIQLYNRLPLSQDDLQTLSQNKPAIVDLFTRIFPALSIIAVLFVVWINVLLGGKILYRSGIATNHLSKLAEWKAPSVIVWIFLAGGGAALMSQPHIHNTGLNIVLVAAFIFFLQGLAIVSFFFQNRDISPFFRGLIYFLIAIQQMLMIAIAAMGFFDLWVDFRKYFRKEQLTDK